jgi:hypothetical protein
VEFNGAIVKKNFSGHSHPVTRDYEVVDCDNCDGVVKMPKVYEPGTIIFDCPHCGHLHEFEVVYEDEDGV